MRTVFTVHGQPCSIKDKEIERLRAELELALSVPDAVVPFGKRHDQDGYGLCDLSEQPIINALLSSGARTDRWTNGP